MDLKKKRIYGTVLLLSLFFCSCQIQYRRDMEKPGTPPRWQYGMGGFMRYDGYNEVAGDLEIPVALYKKAGSLVEIQLVGTVHIGDSDYYKTLQKKLDSCDLVLYEAISSNNLSTTPDPFSKTFYGALSKILGLSSQLESLRYDGKNWKQCDLLARNSPSKVPAEMEQAMVLLQQISSIKDQIQDLLPLQKVEDSLKHTYAWNLSKSQQMDFQALSKSLREWNEILKTFRENFPQNENLKALEKGSRQLEGTLKRLSEIIIVERNSYVMQELKKEIQKLSGIQRPFTISIFYGAGHLKDFEDRLKQIHYYPVEILWLKAWKMNSRGGAVLSEKKTFSLPSTPSLPKEEKKEEKKTEPIIPSPEKDKTKVQPIPSPVKKDPEVAILLNKMMSVRSGSGIKEARARLEAKGEKILPEILEYLKSPDAYLRKAASFFLRDSRLSEKASQALGESLAQDTNSTVRSFCAEALGNIQNPSKEVLEALQKGLKDDAEPWVKYKCAESLGKTGEKALPFLTESLQSSNLHTKAYSAMGLKFLGPKASSAVPHLCEALKEKDQTVRFHVLSALDQMGPHAAPALSQLLEILKDDSFGQGAMAARVLGEIGAPAEVAVPDLIQALSRNLPIQREALQALGKIGKKAEITVPALVDVLKKTDDLSHKQYAIQSLGAFGEKAEIAVPELIQILQGEHKWLGTEAAKTLGKIGPKAKDALPALEKVREERSWSLGYYARKAIEKIKK